MRRIFAGIPGPLAAVWLTAAGLMLTPTLVYGQRDALSHYRQLLRPESSNPAAERLASLVLERADSVRFVQDDGEILVGIYVKTLATDSLEYRVRFADGCPNALGGTRRPDGQVGKGDELTLTVGRSPGQVDCLFVDDGVNGDVRGFCLTRQEPLGPIYLEHVGRAAALVSERLGP